MCVTTSPMRLLFPWVFLLLLLLILGAVVAPAAASLRVCSIKWMSFVWARPSSSSSSSLYAITPTRTSQQWNVVR